MILLHMLLLLQDCVKFAFNLGIELTHKAHRNANHLGRELVKKKLLILGFRENDTINYSDVWVTRKILTLEKISGK